MALALKDMTDVILNDDLKGLVTHDIFESIETEAKLYKQSNLIRHFYVASPLINFTNDMSDWTVARNALDPEFQIEEEKILYSPRFIHLEEYAHFSLTTIMGSKTAGCHSFTPTFEELTLAGKTNNNR